MSYVYLQKDTFGPVSLQIYCFRDSIRVGPGSGEKIVEKAPAAP